MIARAMVDWLGRSATVERLARAADDGGVAVIAAEGGSGKTALLHQWLAAREHNGVHMADVASDDGLRAALEQLAGGATVVVDGADRLGGDDIARLDGAERGPGGALIVAGRRDPMIAGAALELDGEDLAWSEAEVVDALRRWGRRMSPDEAKEVAWISEGWCVAVRLAAAAGPAVLREDSATLHHQLMRDAAATISPELVAAAVELSVVDQFDATTIDAVLEPPEGGAAVLEALVRNRLFLRPAGEQGFWRFHRLFLQAARREHGSGPAAAAARWPKRATRDAARVSRRFVQSYSVRSNLTDDMLANELLAAHSVELLLEGTLEPPSRAALMRASRGSPSGRAAVGLAALAAGDLEAAELLQDAADPDLLAVGELLRARHAAETAAAAAAAEQLAAAAPDGALPAFAWLELGTLEFDAGLYHQAEEHLELAASLADHAGRWGLAARAWAALALLAASAGRLRAAEQRLDMVDRSAFVPPEAAVRAAVAQAAIAFLRDDSVALHGTPTSRTGRPRAPGIRCCRSTCCLRRSRCSRPRSATRLPAHGSPRARSSATLPGSRRSRRRRSTLPRPRPGSSPGARLRRRRCWAASGSATIPSLRWPSPGAASWPTIPRRR